MRQPLDKLGPRRGQKLRVFFPHDGPIKVMVGTGDARESAHPRCEHDHLLEDEAGQPEWVPGWYLAQPVPRGETM